MNFQFFSLDSGSSSAKNQLELEPIINHIRQHPLYSLVAIQKGVYVIGMKNQFNLFDLPSHPLLKSAQYIADEMGFILYDKTNTKSVDVFGPYFIEQYILMEFLSKHEVAQNVLEYYAKHKEKLQRFLEKYSETQGKGFICWRFLAH